MADDLKDKIRENAEGPAKAAGDAGSVEQHKLTTADNRRHWANADGLSANAANSADVRCTLRNRARYEVANNSYARGIVLTLANDVVGTGPRLQMLTPDAEANRVVEREFGKWSAAVGLPEKLRTMRMARASDGEVFAILTSNDGSPSPINLDLRLLEAEQVCTPDLSPHQLNAVDGIVFDPFGNPVTYHVLKEHPGNDRFVVNSLAYDQYPASNVVHYFRCDRPGQARGIPDITPALPLFAHNEWYRDLIAEHRGPANQSPIILWPYPIDPWPGEPLPDEYDLLIYAKNGHRPQLLEHLAEVFPRHIQIHYGRYQREELFEAARRSRACAYLADDDHGPLALQEILLAGCPTVGVRTGASFVRTGETGVVVDRLPPGRQCAESDEDVLALAVFMEAIEEAQAMDRQSVRQRAAVDFGSRQIVDSVVKSLETVRSDDSLA